MKIKQLEALASEVIGDGKSPNLYFVSIAEQGVVLVSRVFEQAYDYWQSLPRDVETSLEDRKVGTICCTQPVDEGSKVLVTTDDSNELVKS